MIFGKCLAHKTCLKPATASVKIQNFMMEIDIPKGGNRFPKLKNWFWQVEIDFLERGNQFSELKDEYWQLEIDLLK